MSYQIVLNAWSGSDPDRAARKMAQVFRLSLEQGGDIIRKLTEGSSWQFDHKISDQQADPASKYLKSLGFQVHIEPISEGDETPRETTALQTAEQESPGSGKKGYDLAFAGKVGELFSILFSNQIKNIFTLGIYHFWAKTRVRQFIWSNTSLAGDPFSYHGSGKEMCMGFLKLLGILIPLLGLLGAVQFYSPEAGNLFSGVLSLAAIVYVPMLMVGAWKYRLSRTAWRGIRFSFRGDKKEAAWLYVKAPFLTMITLGLYWPYFRVQAENFWRGNSWFGNLPFEFTGKGKDLFGKFVLAVFLTVLTSGIYWIWFDAFLKRYYWSHTHLGGGTFRFTATGSDWFVLRFFNLLILILSLGLAYPWVKVRNQQFFAAHLFLDGDIGLDDVVQEMKQSGALGEEALDAFDIPVDVG
ncbi:MAG: YjgN family protein [Nitrospinaceae bacterium]